MIVHFRHRGLKLLYTNDDRRLLNPDHIDKIRVILARLDRTITPQDMDLPGLKLHPLKGNMAGFWSVTVRANWRIIFCCENENVTDVDLIDYH